MERMPEWFKVRYNKEAVDEISGLMAQLRLNTVCKEANCPNLGECYRHRTATFMILGSQCTRNCRFCCVTHGKPEPVDPDEPAHLAQAVRELKLKHVVVTQVTRDDLEDGGASHFSETIQAVRAASPGTTVEVLISDLKGDPHALETVVRAHPDVLNHNLETVPSLYRQVRPQADYGRSLSVLRLAKELDPSVLTKTGIMVGLGETPDEVEAVMDDARSAGCDIFTVGQYLQPSEFHIERKEYITPEQFEAYRLAGEKKGFRYVASGPLVRSSYRAEEALRAGSR